jgi:hypothetical protein
MKRPTTLEKIALPFGLKVTGESDPRHTGENRFAVRAESHFPAS